KPNPKAKLRRATATKHTHSFPIRRVNLAYLSRRFRSKSIRNNGTSPIRFTARFFDTHAFLFRFRNCAYPRRRVGSKSGRDATAEYSAAAHGIAARFVRPARQI